jgi:signal recognition particle subunit SRP54
MPELPPEAAQDPEAMKKLMDQGGGAPGGGLPGLPGGMGGGMPGGLPGLPGGGFGAPGGGRKATKSPKKKRRK